MQNFSKSQERILLDNPNVEKITDSHVVFTGTFKIKAVALYHEGESPDAIFLKNGIDPKFFIPDFCRNCLKRWAKKQELDGKASFKKESRGHGATGRPTKPDLDSLSMEDLKDIIAVQEELIEILKKKKALARKT